MAYTVHIVFFGGSGGINITNDGRISAGASTFASDQVKYDSTSGDGNITIFAGTVSQGMQESFVVAPRIPRGTSTFKSQVSLSVDAINAALEKFKFVYNSATAQLSIPTSTTLADKEALALVAFDAFTYSRNERQMLANAFVACLSSQIANDLPDEFRSAKEVVMRLGLSASAADAILRMSISNVSSGLQDISTHPLYIAAQNILLTPWIEGLMYETFGSSLVRNIIYGVCRSKPSRVQSDTQTGWQHIRFRAGDEVVIYITFTGTIRVSKQVPLERFGLTSTQLENNKTDIDSASWLEFTLRFVL